MVFLTKNHISIVLGQTHLKILLRGSFMFKKHAVKLQSCVFIF